MTNGQIHCFLAVVEEGSLARAAAALFISQPAVSKSISKLEEELGFPLFVRSGGALQPTEAGRLLSLQLRKSKAELEELLARLRSMAPERSGVLTLGCPETWNPALFYDRLCRRLEEKLPGVKLELECHSLPQLMARLQAGKLDMLMSHEFYPAVQSGLAVRRLTDTGCGILYARQYFGEVDSITRLKDAVFLQYDSDIEKKFGAVVKRVCAEYGFTPTLKNCGRFSNAIFNLSCGRGVMFFTDWDSAVTNTSFAYLPLAYRSPVNLIYAASAPDPLLPRVAEELLSLFGEGA